MWRAGQAQEEGGEMVVLFFVRTTEERRTVSLRVWGSSAAVASISVVLPQEKQLMKTTPRKVPRLRRHSTQRLSNLHGTGTTSIQAINSIRINRRIDKGSPLRDTFSRRLRKDSSNSYSKKSTKAKSNSTKNGCSCDGNADDIAATQKDDLEQCLNDLEELKNSTSTPNYLFVQMADRCIFEKDEDGAYRFYSNSTAFLQDTEVFSDKDKPFKLESTLPTQEIFETFDNTIFPNGDKPNSAITLIDEDTSEGVVVALQSLLEPSMKLMRKEILFGLGYKLSQSPEQEAVKS